MNQILNNFNNKKRNIKNIGNKTKVQNSIINGPNEINKNVAEVSQTTNNAIKDTSLKSSKKIKQYKLQFFISVIILIMAISLLISNIYSYAQKENVSKSLLNSISITKLYSNEQNYTTLDTNIMQNTNTIQEEDPFVIGIIQIEKININYPILSKTSRELLKVSLCRCAGPMPNEVGNLCIAGHNLVDYKLFSRLNELNLTDTVKIYDLKGNMNEYKIYQKYEVDPTDLSCLNQNTEGNKIITLLTCNNVNGKRLIVVGKKI